MKKILLTLAMLVLAMGASALTLEECVLRGNSPRGIGAMQPSKSDGRYFYRMSDDGNAIMRISYAKGDESVLVDTRDEAVTGWDDFEVTADGAYVLLWNNSQEIYRYSFSADYYVYDLKNKTMKALSEGGGEEIATLSPDGKRVAYVKDNNVFVRNLVDGTTVQVTRDGKKNNIIYGVPDWVYQEELGMLNTLNWSSDSRSLAFLRWDESQVKMASMVIYQGTCNPKDEYALYPGRYDFKYPVAGEKNSIVSVHCYDVVDGTFKKLNVPLDEEDYVCHITFSPDPQRLMVQRLNRHQNDLRIYAVNPLTDECKQVYHETSDTWVDAETSQQVQYEDKFFVIPSERSGYMQLYQYDLDGNLMRQLTKDNNRIISQFYGYDKGTKRFYYQSSCGPLNRVVECVDAKGKVTRLAPSTADGQGTASAIFNGDFTYYVGCYSDAQTPNQYRIYDNKGRRVRDLQLNEEYARRYTAVDVPKKEFFTMEHDGYTLNGYMIKPVDFDPNKKYPVIMEHYNGPGSQEVLNKWRMGWEQYFATQGYIVCEVDSRGTGFRGKEFESVTYLNLGKYETEDAVAAANYMAQQPWVDADHIGIMGWSYGGFQTLMAMSEPGSNYACGVSIAPVTTWRFYDSIYTERYMRTPDENPEGYSNFPLNRAENLNGRVLIMFGSADDNVHIVNSMQYVSKLVDMNRTCDMMVFPNMNHSIRDCSARYVVYKRALEFYDQYLK